MMQNGVDGEGEGKVGYMMSPEAAVVAEGDVKI